MGRGFWRKPKWLKKLAKSPDDVTILADASDQAADKSRPSERKSKPTSAANYKPTPVAALDDAPELPLISAPWASIAAPRLDDAPGRPEFHARRAHKSSKPSKPQPAEKGKGDARKSSAVRIQAVYRGYRVRRHVASFKNSARVYSSKLGRAKKAPSRPHPQLPGAPDMPRDTGSERIHQWADNAAQHPFDALSPQRLSGSVDPSPVKHYNNGLERHETKEERRERRRQRAVNKPPPPPDVDDALSVSSIGSQSQDPRTWISSRSSRRKRRGARKSKSSSGSRVAAVDVGPVNHTHYGNAPVPLGSHYQVAPGQHMVGSDATAKTQLNPYGGGTPGGAYSMPHHNPFMPPMSQQAHAAPGGTPADASKQYNYAHNSTVGPEVRRDSDSGGSPQRVGTGYSSTVGPTIFSSPPNYGASAAGPVHDILRDLDELASMRTALAGHSYAHAPAPAASAFPPPGGLGPGFGGLRMSYPPTMAGSSGYIGLGGTSAWTGGMSPIVEHQPMQRPHHNGLNGTKPPVLHNQLYAGDNSSTGHGDTTVAATGASGADDTASVASSMAAEAEERLSRIENMLEKLTKTQR